MPASRAPLLGQDLTQARDTWFFQWFHLVRQATRRDGDVGLIRFTPQGGAFRNQVALDLAVDAAGIISSMTLGLGRKFVDDPDDGPYARDIAQAFLRAALPPAEAAAARALADEIATPEVAAESDLGPSEAYGVFLGHAPECILKSAGAVVTVANLGIEGEDWLLVSVGQRAKGEGRGE